MVVALRLHGLKPADARSSGRPTTQASRHSHGMPLGARSCPPLTQYGVEHVDGAGWTLMHARWHTVPASTGGWRRAVFTAHKPVCTHGNFGTFCTTTTIHRHALACARPSPRLSPLAEGWASATSCASCHPRPPPAQRPLGLMTSSSNPPATSSI